MTARKVFQMGLKKIGQGLIEKIWVKMQQIYQKHKRA